jgi:multimeric flavodoxin WrbA
MRRSRGIWATSTILSQSSWARDLSERRHILLITAGHAGGRLERLAREVASGVQELANEIELRELPALAAGVDDLRWAHAVLLGTPEKFGYMAGALKDFFDRTFYPTEGQLAGLPYALFVSAGNDGSGAVAAVERIVTGYRWQQIADPLVVVGEPDESGLSRCRELGQTLAAGLSLGIY